MSDEHQGRVAIRNAVKHVIGPKGSAVVGDNLWAALRDAGWELYRPDEATAAWLGETNTDEIQDLIYDEHAHVIDVSKMEPVWVVDRVPVGESNEKQEDGFVVSKEVARVIDEYKTHEC